MLFTELPYLQRPRAAAQAGFTSVETWWPPDGLAEHWAEEIVRHDLAVASINAYGGDLAAGERGYLNVRERRGEVLQWFGDALALAELCGARRINLLVGREIAERSRAEQLEDAASVLAECASLAGGAGITVLIEPINQLDVPGYLVPTPASALELIRAAGVPSARLLYDAYHAARSGLDPCTDVVPLIPAIGHVQYADCPGRGAPGTGTVDLLAFARALEGGGYAGAIGLEFDPRGPTADALPFVAAYRRDPPSRPLYART
jgi:hydroxypyruvate isomerase